MHNRNATRLALVATLLVAGGALFFIARGGLHKDLVYYLDVQELRARESELHGQTVRLGGLVQNDSVRYDAATLALDFTLGLAAEGGVSVPVHAVGTPPQMFQAGQGAVVEGRYQNGVFAGERVMVKHSNEYRPPPPGEHPKEIYKTLQADNPAS